MLSGFGEEPETEKIDEDELRNELDKKRAEKKKKFVLLGGLGDDEPQEDENLPEEKEDEPEEQPEKKRKHSEKAPLEYEKPEQRAPIVSIKLASDVPEAQRTPLQLLRTDSQAFIDATEARRNRVDGFYTIPVGHIDLCNVPLPVRIAD